MADDNRRLIPMSIKHLDGDNWLISVDGGESYKVKGDLDSIKKVCRRIKAKDGENNNKCRSAKVGTYMSMISDQDNEEHKINVWKSKVPHSADEFKKLMESKDGRIITLSKNYLIEGNIVPKGTVITLREEEIGFLPTDVWNKAKDMPENERFDYVKSQIGDKYTDDEIKSFLDKYKSNLNESLKERTVPAFGDMMDMLEDTLVSEERVSEDKVDDILDVASDDPKLIDAWEMLLNADDKTFVKCENNFWKIFDSICKSFK